jgi:hypothetical protein
MTLLSSISPWLPRTKVDQITAVTSRKGITLDIVP